MIEATSILVQQLKAAKLPPTTSKKRGPNQHHHTLSTKLRFQGYEKEKLFSGAATQEPSILYYAPATPFHPSELLLVSFVLVTN